MNTKEIEQRGFEALKAYIEQHFLSHKVKIDDIRSKKQNKKQYGCDLVITIDGKEYYIELKASLMSSLPTNIRFTHQTIATMHNAGRLQNMILAYVYNLDVDEGKKPKFKFLRFGDLDVDDILVEPHFIIQPKRIERKTNKLAQNTPMKDDLVLTESTTGNDISSILATRVSDHMKIDHLKDSTTI
jgi:hypothetical protein